jgi:membrane-bound lytic murein transglycosylase D
LRKLKQISILGILGFSLIQATKATGINQQVSSQSPLSDTSVNLDSVNRDTQSLYDLKKGFTNLFTTAVTGDGSNGAKLNPMAVSFVKNFINKNEGGFLKMKQWAKPYFDMMDEVLEQHGLPKELKYIAVIESGLKYNANTRSGAAGPWAFMPAAAREYGLKITKHVDERMDYKKSTHAAASLLTDFFARYGDWLLVIAAYNSGPGNVDKAIRKCGGSKDFWVIQHFLPNETMNHVKKFIATHYIFEGEGGITTVTKKELKELLINPVNTLNEEEISNTKAYNISGRFHSSVILKYIDLDKTIFDRLNPNFDNKIAEDAKYELRLPTIKMNTFIVKRYEILDESMQMLLKQANGGTQ